MSKNLDYKLKRMEKGPLQKLKNQNAVLKKFGEKGLKIYRGINGKKTGKDIINEFGFDSDFVVTVIAWLEEKEMIVVSDVKGKEKIKDEGEITEEKEDETKQFEKELQKKEIDLEVEKSEITPEIEPETTMLGQDEKELQQIEKKEIEEEHEKEDSTEEKFNVSKQKSKLREIIEHEAEDEKKETESEEITLVKEEMESEEKVEEGKEEVREKHEEEIEEEMEEEAPSKSITLEKADEEISPEIENEEEFEPKSMEKIIKEKYGDIGFEVYSLIDGQKTAEEIMSETGISETELIEMLEFMEKQGIIKLEHPETKTPSETEVSVNKFMPFTDDTSADLSKELHPVELPTKINSDLFSEILFKVKIASKFGENGSKVLNAIDGKTTDVDLSLKLKIPFYEVRDLLSFFISNKMIAIKQLNREDISKKYGEDCFAIYKKYGKEGILLYELIGNDIGIKQIFQLITKDKERFVDMFIFIHKILGIELPIDKDVIYSQLEEKK
ncbi:MAG: hypothetical protein AB1391_04130 [Candidatus Micrarchaeota archaeon]